MSVDDILAGNTINADDVFAIVGFARPVQVIKASATNRASTISPTADPELSISLAANQTHEVHLDLLVSSAANAAGDLRLRLAWTNTATVTWGLSALSDALASGSTADFQAIGAASDGTSPTTDTQMGTSTTPTLQSLIAIVVTGGSTVAMTLEWAQLASNVSNTSVLAGSRMWARRIV